MDGFTKFLLRGNVVDLAVAVVIGAAFGRIVSSFASAFISPLVGVVTGATGEVKDEVFTVSGVEFPYGDFVDAVLSFLIIAMIVYFLVVQPVQRLMDRLSTEPEVAAETRPCAECLSSIPAAASRCAFCTAGQPVAGTTASSTAAPSTTAPSTTASSTAAPSTAAPSTAASSTAAPRRAVADPGPDLR